MGYVTLTDPLEYNMRSKKLAGYATYFTLKTDSCEVTNMRKRNN